jgi:hypothetical protein
MVTDAFERLEPFTLWSVSMAAVMGGAMVMAKPSGVVILIS